MKKFYKTPELKTQKIELGVFGDYGCGGGHRRRGGRHHGHGGHGGHHDFSPLNDLEGLGLTMD